MNRTINRVFIKRYKWLEDDNVIEGVALMNGNIFKAFIPFTEIYRLSDKMVDLLETYEKEQKEEVTQ